MIRRLMPCRIVLIGMLGLLVTHGCAYLRHETQTHPIAITERDAAALHPGSGYTLNHRHLSPDESRQINERFGAEVTRPHELIAYYVVTRHPKRMTGTSGTVFLEPVQTDHGVVFLLISVAAGAPQGIVVRDGPAAVSVPHEFLDQFIGRDLNHSYLLGREPADFSKVPSPLIPLKGREDLSQRIADAVRKVLVIAEAVHR